MSGLMASRLVAVSMRVSPLVVDDEAAVKLTPSADRRLAAISNEVRVRVDGFEEEVDHRLAAQGGHLLDGALGDLQEALAEIEDGGDLLGGQVLHAEEVLVRKRVGSGHDPLLSRSTTRSVSPRSAEHHAHRMLGRGLQAHADEVGLDGQLAPAAVDQHGELDQARPPVVEQHVHGRAHGAAGVEHVVDQHHRAAVDALVELGRRRSRAWAGHGRRRRGRG